MRTTEERLAQLTPEERAKVDDVVMQLEIERATFTTYRMGQPRDLSAWVRSHPAVIALRAEIAARMASHAG